MPVSIILLYWTELIQCTCVFLQIAHPPHYISQKLTMCCRKMLYFLKVVKTQRIPILNTIKLILKLVFIAFLVINLNIFTNFAKFLSWFATKIANDYSRLLILKLIDWDISVRAHKGFRHYHSPILYAFKYL